MPRFILIGLLIITLGSAGYFYSFKRKQKFSAVPVKLVPVREGPFTASALASGKIVALRKEQLVSPIAGIVYDPGFAPGRFLRKETLVASVRLSEPDLRKKQRDYEFAQLDLDILSERLEYQEELLRAKAISEGEVKDLRIRKYKSAKRVQSLREELKMRPVKTSFAGALVGKRFHNGDRVAAGSVLCTIVDTASYAVDISVPQHVMSQVKLNQIVRFSSDLFAGFREGKVIEMAQIATEQNYQYGGDGAEPEFSVLASIRRRPKDNPLVGSEVEARFVLSEKPEALYVPLEAILYRNDTPVVLLVRNTIAIQQPIAAGLTNDVFIEIVSGLAPGDTVITTGNLDIKPGDRIHDIDDESPEAENQPQFSRGTSIFTL